MAAPSLQELYLGSFCYFIPLGVTVDSAVVSATAKPDGSPSTNWTDYNLGTVLSFAPGVETKDRSYFGPDASGGWSKRNKTTVVQDFMDIRTREMGELLMRLQFGLTGAIVLGTAQTPFAASERKVTGWLKFHSRKENGLDLCIADVLCDVELTGGIKGEDSVTEPEFRCVVLKTYGGVAVAGNTIVFPVES